MKKLLSVILTVTLIVASLSMVASAYTPVATDKILSFSGYSSITVPAEDADEEIELKLLLKQLPDSFNSEAGFYMADMLSVGVVTNGVEIQSSTFTSHSALGIETSTAGTPTATTLRYSYAMISDMDKVLTDDKLAAVDYTIVTFKVKRTSSEIKTATVSFDENMYLFNTPLGNAKVTASEIGQNLTINFEEEKEEEFTVTPGETADGYKSISFFTKNPSGKVLAAGNYGVYFGGQKFLGGLGSKIAGGTDYTVSPTGAWVITIIDNNATKEGRSSIFNTGAEFNYEAFYIIDGVETIVPNTTASWTVQ